MPGACAALQRRKRLRLDRLDRQQIQDLPRAAGDVAVAGHPDHERRHCFWQPFGPDRRAHFGHGRLGLGQVAIRVRMPDSGERGRRAFPRQPAAQRPERLQRAGDPREPAEEDQPPALVVRDLLVVDQVAAQVEDALEHRHVVWLTLDHVGEEHVRLPRRELFQWDLFYAEDDRAGCQVLLQHRTRGPELRFRKGPAGGRLHVDLDAMFIFERPGVFRCNRDAAFPAALVLATDSDAWLHGLSS